MKLTSAQRSKLIAMLREGGSKLRPTRVTSNDLVIHISGGRLPAMFNGETLFVWSKSGGFSGAPMSVEELQLTQDIVRKWYAEVYCT